MNGGVWIAYSWGERQQLIAGDGFKSGAARAQQQQNIWETLAHAPNGREAEKINLPSVVPPSFVRSLARLEATFKNLIFVSIEFEEGVA